MHVAVIPIKQVLLALKKKRWILTGCTNRALLEAEQQNKTQHYAITTCTDQKLTNAPYEQG
jgi:hypothetical protein